MRKVHACALLQDGMTAILWRCGLRPFTALEDRFVGKEPVMFFNLGGYFIF
jgi:hypothetical protein